MFHDELTLIDENWVDLIFAGPTNPQGLERKNQKRDTNKANPKEMTPEKNKSFVEETRNTEDGVISFRGEGCNIPLLCPRIFCNCMRVYG